MSERTNLFEGSDPRFRSGQTRERIPSNAWARKIAAPTKPITAVIVSNIANVLYATARQKTAATLHSQKDFRAPTHIPIDRGFRATDVRLVDMVARIAQRLSAVSFLHRSLTATVSLEQRRQGSARSNSYFDSTTAEVCATIKQRTGAWANLGKSIPGR